MTGNEKKYLNEAFASNWIAPLGTNVDSFEKELSDNVGVRDAVAVSSGTAAIHLGLRLLQVNKGDTVFCSSLTFVASANPILYQGAEPIFIDSEPDTWNMSPGALERAFIDAVREGKLPKAVIVVNLYGQSAKMDQILSICDRYEVPVIEDAAESLGSTYKGKKSGTFGRLGVYSFNGNKIITTSGGGMLVSNDVDAIKQARFLASQARDHAPYYQHSEVGYNYRMSNLLAGVGRAQLEVLEDRVNSKRKIYNRYYCELSNIPGITFMPELKGSRSNRWLTTITIDEKKLGVTVNELLQSFAAENIEARHVWKPLHLQPLFKDYRFYSLNFNDDIASKLFKTGICLPSGTGMLDEEQSKVISCLRKMVKITA
jgi:pyridoxal phosphate-dependent aminotransferase EpsN